jgi:hypothetical protein
MMREALPRARRPVAGAGVSVGLSNDQIKRVKEFEKKAAERFFSSMITLVKDMRDERGTGVPRHHQYTKFGEIIHSVPSLEDLKNGKFDLSFEAFWQRPGRSLICSRNWRSCSDVEKIDISPVVVNAATETVEWARRLPRPWCRQPAPPHRRRGSVPAVAAGQRRLLRVLRNSLKRSRACVSP